MSSSIYTLISPTYTLHEPPNEYLHGVLVPYFDVPQRVDVIRDALQEQRLIAPHVIKDMMPVSAIEDTHNPLFVQRIRDVSRDVEQLVRIEFEQYNMGAAVPENPYYYDRVFPLQAQGAGRQLFINRSNAPNDKATMFSFDNTAPIGNSTWDAVCASASVAYEGSKALEAGRQQVYALCRPPGHHAGTNFMGGFCYLNNAAIAANYLKQSGRVTILDIDYHYGNGTDEIFLDDQQVQVISLHGDVADDYPYYQYTSESTSNKAINLQLGTTDTDYLAALEDACHDIRKFRTHWLIISLGFDTYEKDPISSFKLTLDVYPEIAKRIQALNLPTLYVQEGGYDLTMLGEMAVRFFTPLTE